MVFIMRYIEIPSNMLEKEATLVGMIFLSRMESNDKV